LTVANGGGEGGGSTNVLPAGGGGGAAGAGGRFSTLSWSGCPTAEDFPNDPAGTIRVEVTEAAVYCATFEMRGSLKEVRESKALLRVAPGSYTLPDGGGNNLGLPFCLRLGEDGEPIAVGVGEAGHEKVNNPGDIYNPAGTVLHMHRLEQPVAAPAGGGFEATLSIELLEGEAPSFVLAGLENLDMYGAQDSYFARIDTSRPVECEDGPCYWTQTFNSCAQESYTLNRHDVRLDTGDISLELRIGPGVGSNPAAFVGASGQFRGQSFEQRNYFKLIYLSAGHHLIRHFAVLFDAQIDGVCGVEITGLDVDIIQEIFDEDPAPDQAFAVDCELNRLEELTVQSHTLTTTEP
jgi:hypothetical protein